MQLNGKPLEEVDCFKYLYGCNWQRIKIVKGMWNTERTGDIELEER